MPYANEHTVRYHNPDRYVKIRRKNGDFAPGVDVIYGITKRGNVEIQSIHFKADRFTITEVKRALKGTLRKIGKPLKIEPAKKVNPNPAGALAAGAVGGFIANLGANEITHHIHKNPPAGATKIYDRCLNIRVKKNGKEYDLEFLETRRCPIYGLANGDVLITGVGGKPGQSLGICLEIRAQKGTAKGESLWPGEFFKHEGDTESKAKIKIIKGGDILIHSPNERLWKIFNYD